MQKIVTWISVSLSLLLINTALRADDWVNRPNVVRAAQSLADEVEVLDEIFHKSDAPESFIKKYHHFEETVLEILELAKAGTEAETKDELKHLREDVGLIAGDLANLPALAAKTGVSEGWAKVRTAFRVLESETLKLPFPQKD